MRQSPRLCGARLAAQAPFIARVGGAPSEPSQSRVLAVGPGALCTTWPPAARRTPVCGGIWWGDGVVLSARRIGGGPASLLEAQLGSQGVCTVAVRADGPWPGKQPCQAWPSRHWQEPQHSPRPRAVHVVQAPHRNREERWRHQDDVGNPHRQQRGHPHQAGNEDEHQPHREKQVKPPILRSAGPTIEVADVPKAGQDCLYRTHAFCSPFRVETCWLEELDGTAADGAVPRVRLQLHPALRAVPTVRLRPRPALRANP